MRTPRSGKRYKVFEFDEEDERIEKASKKFLGQFRNPNSDDSELTKYSFRQYFSQGTETQHEDFSNEPLDVDACDGAVTEKISATSHAARATNLEVTSTGTKQLDTNLPQFLSDNEPVCINIGDDNSIELSSSTSTSDPAENKGPPEEQALDHGFSGCDSEAVVISPDYIICGNIYCTESRLTFSCSYIKLEGSAFYGFEWTIGNIIKIESQWSEQVEMATVNLYLKSKYTKVAENANKSSGLVKLTFAVCDPHWSERQEAIKSLDVRYKAIWSVGIDIDTARNEYACLGQRNKCFLKNYFFNLDESFKEVIYPKGDPDAVTISRRDAELLKPGTFINDTIIDFYIKYLKDKIKPGEKHRFHFFNSFFFRKLADLDKDASSRACKSRADFQCIHKWTRKVNLFEKDYIFIPVNFSLHWSLIVICHPGEVANSEGEDMERSPKIPCILHMDSIKGSHRGLKNLIQSYLWEEWKGRQSEPVGDFSSKFMNLQFVPLELPQQENSCDCGLFLLHYVERFLEQAPVNFSPFKITKFSNFLNKNWFPPEEASLKRARIEKLIYEIVEDSSQIDPPTIYNYNCPSELPKINESDTGVEFLQERCRKTDTFHGNYFSSTADQEVEITQLAAAPPGGVQCFRESELVFMELEPGSTASLLTDGNYQTFRQMASLKRFKNVLSSIEETEETEEQTAYSPTDEVDGQQLAEKIEPSKTSYSAKDFGPLGTSLFPGAVRLEEKYDKDLSGTDVREDERVSSEVAFKEDNPPEEFSGSNPEDESSSASSDRFAACVVEDSLDANETDDDNENEDSPCEATSLSVSNQQTLTACLKGNNMWMVSESEQDTARKLRIMPPKGRR